MIVNFKEQDKSKTNVVYMINLYTAPYGKKFVYIGITKRRLQTRINEHLYYNTKRNTVISTPFLLIVF